jgi:hypothetical protein
LRERYLAIGGNSQDLEPLLAKSLSSLSVLFKATLRLIGAPVPALHREAVWKALNEHVPIDVACLEEIWSLRSGKKAVNPEDLFARLVDTVEKVVDHVDKFQAL